MTPNSFAASAADQVMGAASGCFDISTDPVNETERFDFYTDVIAKQYMGIDAAGNFGDNFVGRMSVRVAGDVQITSSVCGPARWARTRRSLLDGEESIVISLLHSGRAHLTVGSQDFSLFPGSVALVPSSVPCEKQGIELYRSSSVKLPRAAVETALRPGHLVAPMLFRPDDPIVGMLIHYAGNFVRNYDNLSHEAGAVAGRHIADLTALAIGAHRDAQAEIAERGLKAARIEAILEAIARSFAAPFVSPATIGSTLGISERHVHRLLEETNRSFYEHLLEARLSNAFRLLRDSRGTGRPIAEIAAESGFMNVSYFNRVFRQRFGDTPSGVRALRTGDKSTRSLCSERQGLCRGGLGAIPDQS